MLKYGQQTLAELGDYPARLDVQPPTVRGIALPTLDRVFRMSVEESLKTQAPDCEVGTRPSGRSSLGFHLLRSRRRSVAAASSFSSSVNFSTAGERLRSER